MSEEEQFGSKVATPPSSPTNSEPESKETPTPPEEVKQEGRRSVVQISSASNNVSLDDTPMNSRFKEVSGLVRTMSNGELKAQCITSEWSLMQSDTERELLLDVAVEPDFWKEVKLVALADAEAQPDEQEDDVDTESRLRQMFKCFDKDNSGSIDASELHQMLLYMGVSATDVEVKEIMAQVDQNGDGDIDEAEFLQVMKAAQNGQLNIAAPTRKTIRRASIRLAETSRGSISN